MSWALLVLNVITRLLAKTAVFGGQNLTATLADNACRPEKIHLALMPDISQMRVSWSTRAHGCHGHVYFGRMVNEVGSPLDDSENHLDMVVDHIDAGSYGPDDLCSEPAIHDEFAPPHLHTAIMSDLVPGAIYKYRIDHHKKVLHFKAAPQTKADSKFLFIAYGDMGESKHASAKSPGAAKTAERVSKEVRHHGASLVVHLGDISYANGKHKIWDSFMELIEPYASRVPYQVVVGNHEYDWKTGREHHHKKQHPTDASGKDEMYDPDWGNYGNDSGGECGVIFSKLFTMPGSHHIKDEVDRIEAANHRSDIPNPPFWFSYDYGGVHFTTLSSEHDLTAHSHQIKWLEQDLAKVDRCVTPWLVVLIHRPLYVVHPHKSNRVVGEHLRKSLEEILEKHQVDLIMSGHVHAYARTCKISDGKCVKNRAGGITHLTLGNGGRKLSEVKHEQPDWLEFAERKWGYARISVHGSEHMLIEYVSSETGKVRDSVKLKTAASAMKLCTEPSQQIVSL